MKRNTKKLIVIFILVMIFVVVFTSVSYSYQSGSIDINGNTKVNKNSWNIYFTNLNVISNKMESKIFVDNKTSKVDITGNINKKIEFTIDVINDSLYDLTLDNIRILGLDDEILDKLKISYSYEDKSSVKLNDHVLSGETKVIKITINNSDKALYDLDFSIQFDFIQS